MNVAVLDACNGKEKLGFLRRSVSLTVSIRFLVRQSKYASHSYNFRLEYSCETVWRHIIWHIILWQFHHYSATNFFLRHSLGPPIDQVSHCKDGCERKFLVQFLLIINLFDSSIFLLKYISFKRRKSFTRA